MNKLVLPALTLLLATSLVALPAWADQWYRYENDDGVMVMSNAIPPSMVHRGYQVLDAEGRVVRIVERQLTEAEIAEREAKKAEEARKEEERLARQRRDQELMMLYASPDDVEYARDRRVAAIENSIRATRANIERLQDHKHQLESQAADRERAGHSPSRELLDNIQIIEIQIRESEREIVAREQEVRGAIEQFDREHRRVTELYEALASSR